jgi:regulatory protein
MRHDCRMTSSRATTKSGAAAPRSARSGRSAPSGPSAPSGRSGRDPRAFVSSSLAAKAQSVAEIEAKLAARGVEPQEAASIVAQAVRLGYLDDEELAGQLARGFRSRGYGRRRASQTLRRRGIAASLAEAVLDDAYGAQDEVELAVRALGRRASTDDGGRRAAAFLLRRGFSPVAAWQAARRVEPP